MMWPEKKESTYGIEFNKGWNACREAFMKVINSKSGQDVKGVFCLIQKKVMENGICSKCQEKCEECGGYGKTFEEDSIAAGELICSYCNGTGIKISPSISKEQE